MGRLPLGPWRDVVVFGVLCAGLVLRPYGLLGQPFARDNPMLAGRSGPSCQP